MIDDYVKNNSGRAIAFDSLGQRNYLSALQHVQMVVGNSSSGLIEVPSFKIPTVNIGDRQGGREQAQTVIQCDPQKESILKPYTKDFLKNSGIPSNMQSTPMETGKHPHESKTD